ncbi:MAG TPA: hypothetical protein VKT33_04365 [Candidatus Angelobacter sp.]|nr:hypothetical protein [Candidatus Angelobacter sp.]
MNNDKKEAEAANPPAKEDPCKIVAFSYLLALKEGNPIGFGYWKTGTTPTKLFNVRDYSEITHGRFVHPNGTPYKVPRSYYQYDVQSSTQGGFAIRKRWNVVMEPGTKGIGNQPCAIVELTAAE